MSLDIEKIRATTKARQAAYAAREANAEMERLERERREARAKAADLIARAEQMIPAAAEKGRDKVCITLGELSTSGFYEFQQYFEKKGFRVRQYAIEPSEGGPIYTEHSLWVEW
jgi:hypothetical protein